MAESDINDLAELRKLCEDENSKFNRYDQELAEHPPVSVLKTGRDYLTSYYILAKSEHAELEKQDEKFVPLPIPVVIEQLNEDIQSLKGMDQSFSSETEKLESQIAEINNLIRQEELFREIILKEKKEISETVALSQKESFKKLILKYENAKKFKKLRKSQLHSFLQQQFSLTSESELEEDALPVPAPDVLFLSKIITDLIAVRKRTGNPWFELGPTVWRQHVELLLRTGIAKRHDANPNLIRLV